MGSMIRIVTHSGSFHTDEVFAVATLTLLLGEKNCEVVRTRDVDVMATGDYVVDVGGEYSFEKKIFDHHQKGGAGTRENGVPYSSFGLVWKHYGAELCASKRAAEIIDERLVTPVDASDNGIETYEIKSEHFRPYILHNVIEVFRPTWKEQEEGLTFDEQFDELVEVARALLLREIRNAQDIETGDGIVREIYEKSEDKRIVIIEGQYPWEYILSQYPEPLFVVKPAPEGGEWRVKAVRSEPTSSFENRKDLPAEWAGKTGEELARVSGVSDARFCHNKRFIAVAGSKEGALQLAKIAVEN
jgi:uncharacterized UPF0160 family protein